MIALLTSFQLRCFQSNTTVMLDVQTRDAVFKAWPRTDATRETELCGKLKGDMFKLSIQTGAYEYVLNTLQSYDPAKYIEIRLPCTEVVLGVPGTCATAFKAKSAIYTMDFQEAKQNVTEAASNLRKLDFDRKACFQNARMDLKINAVISPTVTSNVFQFVADARNCRYPVDSTATIALNKRSDMKAQLSFFGFPGYNFTDSRYSLPINTLITETLSPCALIPIPASVKSCTKMVTDLAVRSSNYFQMNYTVPGKIPNRDGTLTRIGNYTNVMESNVIKNTNQQEFDCYNSQRLVISQKEVHLINILKQPTVNCSKPIKTLMGDFDKMVTRISFQEFQDFRLGNVYTIDFQTKSQVINSTDEWLTCDQSTNQTHCLEVLGKSGLSEMYLNAQQLFYKAEAINLLMALTVTPQFCCFQNASFGLSNDQVCAEFAQSCQASGLSAGSNQFTFSFGDIGKFGNNLLNVSTQGTFSTSNNKYCANHAFSTAQIAQLVNADGAGAVTGSLKIGSVQIPVAVITDNSAMQQVKNIQWFVVGTAALIVVFTAIGLWKQWV
ncbi:Conserved_hypothetical protein [Hexamita inflata]|uniref:Uncharacterized protein n=1 Tax=Hexamita inflata TaxID=28002 RepID=A0AA86UT54_9EUKA|nr:Conserved hypothetical protein [Hexamita inflata]